MLPSNLLVSELKRIGAVKTGKFVLSSGRESDIYIDLRMVPSYPRVFKLILSSLYQVLYPLSGEIEGIIGVATGGLPWASGLALLAGLPLGYVRQERKEHGRGRLVETALSQGSRLIVVDDVATTGGSIERAVMALRSEGYDVRDAVVVVDREEGASERLASIGVRLWSVLKMRDIRVGLEKV